MLIVFCMKQVLIIGGGFAGVRVSRRLKNQANIRVTIVNEDEDFRYCPALYRAVTGFKLGTARLPLEWMLLDSSNVDLIVGKAVRLDRKKKQVILQDNRALPYDYVVFALGSVTTYFDIEGLHEHAYGIKTSQEIIQLREHLHEKMIENSKLIENYVIVGAGPSGVELAGALGSYLQKIARRHRVKNPNLTIWLVDAAPRILPQMHERVSRVVAKRMKKLGIKLELDTKVEAENLESLSTSAGKIKTHTVIWTAGAMNNPFFAENKESFSLNKRNKVVVDSHLQVVKNVYVIGDNAATKFSGTAMTAIKHGNFAAKDIIALVNNKDRPRKYESHPVQIVPTGKKWAIMQYRKFVLYGRPVSYLRKIADYIGYSDVMGYARALTIWTNSDRLEDTCQVCKKRL